MSVNSLILTGRIEGPFELKTSQAGKPYARFAFVSTREARGNAEAERAKLNAVVFGALADKVGRFAGSDLLLTGRLKSETWTTQDGQERESLRLLIEDVQVMASVDSAARPPAAAPATPPVKRTTAYASPGASADEAPF